MLYKVQKKILKKANRLLPREFRRSMCILYRLRLWATIGKRVATLPCPGRGSSPHLAAQPILLLRPKTSAPLYSQWNSDWPACPSSLVSQKKPYNFFIRHRIEIKITYSRSSCKTTSALKVSKKSTKISTHRNLPELQIVPRGDNSPLGVKFIAKTWVCAIIPSIIMSVRQVFIWHP